MFLGDLCPWITKWKKKRLGQYNNQMLYTKKNCIAPFWLSITFYYIIGKISSSNFNVQSIWTDTYMCALTDVLYMASVTIQRTVPANRSVQADILINVFHWSLMFSLLWLGSVLLFNCIPTCMSKGEWGRDFLTDYIFKIYFHAVSDSRLVKPKCRDSCGTCIKNSL